MDPAIVPDEPHVKENGERRFVYFNKKHWDRSQIERWLDAKWPDHVKATWFDQGDVHKIVIELPRRSRGQG